MEKGIKGKVSCGINAPVSKVWEVLTTPELTKKFLFGTEVNSDWKTGSPITFTGVWDGISYENKGIVIKSNPYYLLQFTVSGGKDKLHKEINITYELKEKDNETTLTVIQENLSDEKMKENSEYNWKTALTELKVIVEEYNHPGSSKETQVGARQRG